MISRIFQDNTMRDKYTYEQISEATEMFLLGVERNDNNARISEDTGICQTRIKTWKHRYNIIAKRYQAEDRRCLQFISNLTYGVSEDVWNRWLCAIDERLEEIRNCEVCRMTSELFLKKSLTGLTQRYVQREERTSK